MDIHIRTLSDGRYRIDYDNNVTQIIRAEPGEKVELAEGLYLINPAPSDDQKS